MTVEAIKFLGVEQEKVSLTPPAERGRDRIVKYAVPCLMFGVGIAALTAGWVMEANQVAEYQKLIQFYWDNSTVYTRSVEDPGFILKAASRYSHSQTNAVINSALGVGGALLSAIGAYRFFKS